MDRSVTVACVQVEPVVLDRDATLDKIAALAAEAAGAGVELVVFPETFVPVYPSSVWARAFAGWQIDGAKETFARIAQGSIAVGSPAERRLGEIAKEHGVWLVTGVNEVEPDRPGTIYNALLYHAPDGSLALHHRKLVPTNHERLIWGQGDGRGLHAVETGFGRVGGLICWENYMPLARFALYASGVEIYIASTADDGDAWQATLVHIARESRAFVVAPAHFQRTSAYPEDFALRHLIDGVDIIGHGGSAILAPDGSYLAGPLYDAEGILYAELDAARVLEERQRFDAVGHYNRPDVLGLTLNVPD
jgi:nitrilase